MHIARHLMRARPNVREYHGRPHLHAAKKATTTVMSSLSRVRACVCVCVLMCVHMCVCACACVWVLVCAHASQVPSGQHDLLNCQTTCIHTSTQVCNAAM